MADTLTEHVKLTDQEEGQNNNSWGQIADGNFHRIDAKFGATTAITTTGGDTTLTDIQEIVNAIEIDGTLASNANIIFSGRGSSWTIKNGTAGNFTLTCKVSGQTGVVIPQGTQKIVYCNGTDINFSNPETAAAAEVSVASGSTANILGANSEFVNLTGTSTITSFGTGTNRKRYVRCSGACKISPNGTSLITPTGKVIECEVGDGFVVLSDANSNARILIYQRASGKALEPDHAIGDLIWKMKSGTLANHLRCNGTTIGSASSGASQLASDEAETLFLHLWNTYPDTVCPVTGGRGGSAAADWAGNRKIAVPDGRGKAPFGLDDMGASAAGVIAAGTPTVPGSGGGAETVTLTTAHLPASGLSFSANVTAEGVQAIAPRFDTSGDGVASGGGFPVYNTSNFKNLSVSGTTGNMGSGNAHNNMPPYWLGTWHIRYK